MYRRTNTDKILLSVPRVFLIGSLLAALFSTSSLSAQTAPVTQQDRNSKDGPVRPGT